MTLASQISADATAIFLETDDFAQTITRYAGGSTGSSSTITCIVDLDDEEQGQGTAIEDERGTKIVRYGRLDMLSTQTIVVNEQGRDSDTFLIDSELWCAVRFDGRDGIAGMKTLIIRRDEKISAKHPNVRR